VVPDPWMAVKSCGRESISRRGRSRPRSGVRLSAACDREPAGRRGHGDRQSSSSGRGSRAPWRDGASWAGTFASSGLLSDPLRPASGTDAPSSPRGTRTRPAPTGAWRVLRPGDDMAGRKGVSNRAPVDPSRRRPMGRRAPSSGDEGPPTTPPPDLARMLPGPSAPGRSRDTRMSPRMRAGGTASTGLR
jgi:hypothetical protein